MPHDSRGNAAKRARTATAGPWATWKTTARHARAIRFIETYCRPPKGEGFGKPIRLAPWQKQWLEESLAPNVDAAVMALPRGNGKSTFAAAIATWALFDETLSGQPQVPIVATTVGQAIRSVYSVAAAMVRSEPLLESRAIQFTGIGTSRVFVPTTGGEMFPIANAVDGLQGLDPSVAIADEVGFQPIESWDALLLASGKRSQSLVMGLGTPGLDRENALWHLRSLVHEGVAIPRFVFREYAADDGTAIDDREQWHKANPALAAGYLQETALETALNLSPEGHFRIFRLGQWVDGVDSWLGPNGRMIWNGLREPYDFVEKAKTWVGLDVGIKRDSTAVVSIQQKPDGKYHAKCRLWIPTNDAPVDVTDVMGYLRELATTYDVEAISFDPRFFDVPAKMLSDEGLRLVEIPQSVERMTAVCGTLLEMTKRSEYTHDDDEAFATHVLNAVPRLNERGFTLQKSKSRGRIDGAVALALAMDRAVHPEPRVGVSFVSFD